jgi:hypothetical protein
VSNIARSISLAEGREGLHNVGKAWIAHYYLHKELGSKQPHPAKNFAGTLPIQAMDSRWRFMADIIYQYCGK